MVRSPPAAREPVAKVLDARTSSRIHRRPTAVWPMSERQPDVVRRDGQRLLESSQHHSRFGEEPDPASPTWAAGAPATCQGATCWPLARHDSPRTSSPASRETRPRADRRPQARARWRRLSEGAPSRRGASLAVAYATDATCPAGRATPGVSRGDARDETRVFAWLTGERALVIGLLDRRLLSGAWFAWRACGLGGRSSFPIRWRCSRRRLARQTSPRGEA